MSRSPSEQAIQRPPTNLEGQLSKLPKLNLSPRFFTCFTRLPLELRLKIWKEACFEPRIIKMNCFIKNRPYGFADHRVEGQPLAPPVLHVCHESRTEAQKCYALFDDSDRWIPGQVDEIDGTSLNLRDASEMVRPLYINFEIDRFVQPNLTSIPPWIPHKYRIAHNFGPDAFSRIRFLQLEAGFDAHQATLGRLVIFKSIQSMLLQMTSLSELTLAVRQAFVPTTRDKLRGRSVEFFSVQLSFQEKENLILEELRKSLAALDVPPMLLERTLFRCRFIAADDEDLVLASNLQFGMR
ncbi:hypothetical protein DL98DRAFT_536381 [Cadophora sp. DSE1049]|nr:hypothetical protein DL98DRAFT_536381 [Cadophora sp. DSE1049]